MLLTMLGDLAVLRHPNLFFYITLHLHRFAMFLLTFRNGNGRLLASKQCMSRHNSPGRTLCCRLHGWVKIILDTSWEIWLHCLHHWITMLEGWKLHSSRCWGLTKSLTGQRQHWLIGWQILKFTWSSWTRSTSWHQRISKLTARLFSVSAVQLFLLSHF